MGYWVSFVWKTELVIDASAAAAAVGAVFFLCVRILILNPVADETSRP